MKNKIMFLFLFITLFGNAQEFRGIDMRAEYIDNSNWKKFTVDLYYKSADTIQMDSFTIGVLGWIPIPKTDHFFYDEDIQMLRFSGETIVGNGNVELWKTQDIWIEDVVNCTDCDSGRFIKAHSVFRFWPFNSDPINNNSQTDFFLADGVFHFDASATDPDGEYVNYFFEELEGVFSENYTFPVGTDSIRIDKLTGVITWDRPTQAGKYLIKIALAETSVPDANVNSGNATRYMIIEVKEEDLVTGIKIPGMVPINESVSIYPNPVLDVLNLKIEHSQISQNNFNLIIYNSLGEIIVVENNFDFSNELDLSELQSGVYWLQISLSNGKEIVESFVVQK